MDTFLSIHQDAILGTLTMFDRLIFKGHLTGLYPQGAFARFLWRQGVLLKEFKPYVLDFGHFSVHCYAQSRIRPEIGACRGFTMTCANYLDHACPCGGECL